MDSLFQETLSALEIAFRALEKQVPAPRQVPFKDSFVFRYVEQTAQQALIQKMARLLSGLHAARLLVDQGFVQEEAVLARALDDFQEDILFLTLGLTVGTLSDLHQRYLSTFYEEEFEKPDVVSSTQKAPDGWYKGHKRQNAMTVEAPIFWPQLARQLSFLRELSRLLGEPFHACPFSRMRSQRKI
jgi:hypothetical protein